MFGPKWISRAADSLEIAMGNHGIAGASGRLEATDEIVCLHAPLRARSILDSKVEQGRRVAALGLDRKQGWHVQRWAELADSGKIEQEWIANSYSDESVDVYGNLHPVVYDPRLRDLVRPWVEQAVERAGTAACPAGPAMSREPDNAEGAALSETETLRRRVQELEELNDAADQERSQLLHAIQIQLGAIPQERTRAIERRTQEVIARDEIIRGLQNKLHTKVGECNDIIEDLQHELHTKVGDCNAVIKDLQSRIQEEVSKRDKLIGELQQRLNEQAEQQ